MSNTSSEDHKKRTMIPTEEVSQEEINDNLANWTRNPERTIVVDGIDVAFLSNIMQKGDEGASGNPYVNTAENIKKDLESVNRNGYITVRTHDSLEKTNNKKTKGDRKQGDKEQDDGKSDEMDKE